MDYRIQLASDEAGKGEIAMAYDENCHELATYFLPREKENSELVAKLAQTIQDAIEDWLKEYEPLAKER